MKHVFVESPPRLSEQTSTFNYLGLMSDEVLEGYKEGMRKVFPELVIREGIGIDNHSPIVRVVDEDNNELLFECDRIGEVVPVTWEYVYEFYSNQAY